MNRFFVKYQWLSRLIAAVLIVPMCMINIPVVQAAPPPGTIQAVSIGLNYDGNGNLTRRVDGNGNVITYTYDAMNLRTAIDYPGGATPDVTFAFDGNGNRTRMTDATGTTEYDYDFYDRLTAINYPGNGFVLYTYDDVGNITDLQYGNAVELLTLGKYTYIQYTYDEDNRLKSVKDVFANETTTYTYDSTGAVSLRVLPNGVTTDYGYDADGRFVSIDHKKADGTRICRYAYTLNAIGNRTQVVETTPTGTATTNYTYDTLDRLDTVTYPNGRFVNYDYDSFGNRTVLAETVGGVTTTTRYTYDNDSRLLATTVNNVANETFFYDKTGNLLQRVRATDNRQINYVYDLENRLVRYYDGTNNVEYIYNAAGERVAKVVNGKRTNFINDPNRQFVQVLAETDNDGTSQRVYAWGNELLTQGTIADGRRDSYLHDSIDGSVRRVVSNTAVVANIYEYDAFGQPTAKTEGIANDYQLHGESQDEETGMLFLRARYADPTIGRFLTRDPERGDLEFPQTKTPYVFVSSDPVNRRDPTGMSDNWYKAGMMLGQEGVLGAFGLVGSAIGIGIAMYQNATARSAFSYSPSYGGGAERPNYNYSSGVRHSGGRGSSSYSSGPNYYSGTRLYGNTAYNSSGSLTGPLLGSLLGGSRCGGIKLDKSASVLLDINKVSGATYDKATGAIVLYGKADSGSTALPPLNLDDLAVAFRAVNRGSMPEVSIEAPLVSSPPEWPGRTCYTTRFGPFVTDPDTGEKAVRDLSSGTGFGWVMFEADRLAKCLTLGKDNITGASVSSSVPGYANLISLFFAFYGTGGVGGSGSERMWFNPKTIEVQPSADGRSMELKKAEMQLSTQVMLDSDGQQESSPMAEYFSTWFTNNYDAIAAEQFSRDATGEVRYVFKELKQLAAVVGIVKWIQDNRIPMDLSFLENYKTATVSTPAYTPQTTATGTGTIGGRPRTISVQGGVNYCDDLDLGSGGNPQGLAAAAMSARGAETSLAWTCSKDGANYNVTAFTVDKQEKPGGFSHGDTDAQSSVNGVIPLVLGRYYDSFDVASTEFGWGWRAQPYALAFKGQPSQFNLCNQQWAGYGEVWLHDRAQEQSYKLTASGVYDSVGDPQHLASRFATGARILVYRYETKENPGLLFSDMKTRMTFRRADGVLLDFNLDGQLTRIQDRNGNGIDYGYANGVLTSMGQAGGRSITFTFGGNGCVASAILPDSHSVTYTYDAQKNLVAAQVDAPNGRKIQYAYDADHNLIEVRDEAGNATESRAYDVYGRVAGTTQPGVPTPISESYNLTGKTSQTTGPEGYSKSAQFNDKSDPVRVTDARNNQTQMTYNSYRDMTSETRGDGTTVNHYYDYRGNRIGSTQPNGRADLRLLDSNGNPTMVFHSQRNAGFDSSFNAERGMTSMANMSIHETGYISNEYDAKGNLTRSTDANNHAMTYDYDTRGNRKWEKDARGNQTNFTYDVYSRLTKRTDALGRYVDFGYDERDNQTLVTTKAGTVENVYNLKNQLTSVTKGDVGSRRTTNYTYNAKGQIASVTDPAGKLTNYGYDVRGNLTSVTHDGILRFSYTYDGLNRMVSESYSGTSGGGQAAIIPISPVGTEKLRGSVEIKWAANGDWSSGGNVIIQYSTNGTTWNDIPATVAAASGRYVWAATGVVSETVQIRFKRTGDAAFASTPSAVFKVLNGGIYYVNDASTMGDEYCTAPGATYNGTTVRGMSQSTPVNSLQAIIDNYPLQPGDIVYVDAGTYSLADTVKITEADSGLASKPVTIRGATGVKPIFTITNLLSDSACIAVYDTNTSDSNHPLGLVIENFKLTGGRDGIILANAQDCIVRNCECYGNGYPGSAGAEGNGAGIHVKGLGRHTIENNICRNNGASGGTGGAGQSGGQGRGAGISIESSQYNIIQRNTCYGNGGMGGAAGAGGSSAGQSEATGIAVLTVDSIAVSRGNQVIDNVCYDNHATGRNDYPASASPAQAFGIILRFTEDSNVERNTVYNNDATGGVSWNGSAGANGGDASGFGIGAMDEQGTVITKNVAYDNKGYAGYGGRDAVDRVGKGFATGIMITRCGSSIVKNNLCRDNVAATYLTQGSEIAGTMSSMGILCDQSPGCEISNNTILNNWGGYFGSGSRLNFENGQIFVTGTSTNCILKNNILDTAVVYTAGLEINANSITGMDCDYNDLYCRGSAKIGVWAGVNCFDLATWRTTSGKDAHSLNVAPGYFNSTTKNYHLISNSPLIDVGTFRATVQEDVDGEGRPAAGPNSNLQAGWDIGYDEFIDTDVDGLADWIEKNVVISDPSLGDSDSDGLPDGWEYAYGLKANDATGSYGASGDPDLDGYSNMVEFMNGSNPGSAASLPPVPPRITSFTPAGANPLLSEGDPLIFTATAVDGNPLDTVSYSWKKDGVVVSTSNSWTLVTDDTSSGVNTLSRTFDIQLVVSAGPDQVTNSWTVTVANKNRAPVMDLLPNLTMRAGQTVSLIPTYSDPDNTNSVPGDNNVLTVTYSDWMTGPTRVTNGGDTGRHTVTVTVADNGSPALSTSRLFEVEVVAPNLTTGAPTGWPNNITVSPTTGTSVDTVPLMVGVPYYIDYAETNSGTSFAEPGAMILLIDSIQKDRSVRSTNLANGAERARTDVPHTFTTEGWHELEVRVDSDGNATEAYESDNIYTRRVYVYPANALQDADKDGSLNWQEILAGTSPTNSASVFRSRIAPKSSSSDFELLWNGATGRKYTVQKCDDLRTGVWSDACIGIPGIQGEMHQTVSRTGARMFYRVRVDWE